MSREEFFQLLGHMSYSDLNLVKDGYWFAKEIHRRQMRDDEERYFEHLRGVALILIQHGYRNASIVVKALLHDLLEDTYTPVTIVLKIFGADVVNSIISLSKTIPEFDPKTGKMSNRTKILDDVYYHELSKSGIETRLVKLADRLYNIRDMNSWSIEKKLQYADHTEKYVIPLADSTNFEFAEELRAEVKKIRETYRIEL